MPTTYRLVRPERSVVVPSLDDEQRRVVEHPGGPLLVLAGPGTGKTTTLVEAIVDRIENRGARPEEVLALTFSRKAAEQLRDRVTARLGRTVASAIGSTFHSFAYGLIRHYTPHELYEGPLRLLSAPEQDVVLQELLVGGPEAVRWPSSLRDAVGTRGFADEAASVLARAREKGLEGPELRELGEHHDRAELVAAGRFLDQYLDVLDSLGAIDYADLIRRAGHLARVHSTELRQRYAHVFVDEYQDTDPGQVGLLRALAGDGRDLVVVGDPHQSIYGFRGADVRGILEFPTAFPTAGGSRADVVVISTTRRFGERLLLASQRVASRLPLPPALAGDERERFVSPVSRHPVPGRVSALTFDTERAEHEHVADLLRRAHLEDDVPWSQMAVLVRSGRASIPGLRRALGAAGVPVEVAGDDTALSAEPAVRVLAEALDVVMHLDAGPGDTGFVDADRAHAMLQSALGGLDAGEIRVLGRILRTAEKRAAADDDRLPRSSPELLRVALSEPETLGVAAEHREPAVRKAAALAGLLRTARGVLVAGGAVDEVLWSLWDGTDWPRRLVAATARGGPVARSAHRDLDAVCALFDDAARAEERRGHTAVASFLATLAAQQIPADTLAEQGIRGDVVRLLTAHRSKGLEWRLVVVAHVQESGWPDLRRRATLLDADRIGDRELLPPTTPRAALIDERRLFYVACTRARERLVVTAVRSTDDDGEQPSRFLDELGVGLTHQVGRPHRPLSLSGLVAELRRTAADERTSEPLRRAAARRLAALARLHRSGEVRVPSADPASWWGTRAATASDEPLRALDEPVRLTASALTSIAQCPTRWFLEAEAGGQRASTQAQGFGNVVHALADRVGRGELVVAPTDSDTTGLDEPGGPLDQLMRHVDEVWEQIPFRTPWSAVRERAEVRAALRRFLAWHARPDAREVLATERRLTASVDLPDGQKVVLHGYADRLEIDAEGRVVVIDLKTGKYVPTNAETDVHPQLGLYQLSVEAGAVEDLAPGAQPGGAELWQLRKEAYKKLKVQRQAPQQPDEDGVRPIEVQLMAAASALRAESFPARPGGHCDHCEFAVLCPAKNAGTVLS